MTCAWGSVGHSNTDLKTEAGWVFAFLSGLSLSERIPSSV